MTKAELSKHAGRQIYALCRRMGGKFKDIDCLTVYRITSRGTLRYCHEAMSIVANATQFAQMKEITRGFYHVGRPVAADISRKDIKNLIIKN